VASIRRMLQKNAGLPPSARLSVKDIYERVRDEEGFFRGYSTVSDYVRPAASDEDCIWEQPYDLLISLEKKRVLDFLVLLSRADPPERLPEAGVASDLRQLRHPQTSGGQTLAGRSSALSPELAQGAARARFSTNDSPPRHCARSGRLVSDAPAEQRP
jgi:hypothetical protein